MKHKMKKMRNTLIIIFCLMATISSFGQQTTEKIKQKVDSLKYVSGDPHECNTILWKIAACKKDAIQLLIDKLDDTTSTQATDICKKTNLRVGDLAYMTLGMMLSGQFFDSAMPPSESMDMNGCTGAFEYLEANRMKFKTKLQAYYTQNKSRMKWMESSEFAIMPCEVENNINGHYYVPE